MTVALIARAIFQGGEVIISVIPGMELDVLIIANISSLANSLDDLKRVNTAF